MRLPPQISQSEEVLRFFETKAEDLNPPVEWVSKFAACAHPVVDQHYNKQRSQIVFWYPLNSTHTNILSLWIQKSALSMVEGELMCDWCLSTQQIATLGSFLIRPHALLSKPKMPLWHYSFIYVSQLSKSFRSRLLLFFQLLACFPFLSANLEICLPIICLHKRRMKNCKVNQRFLVLTLIFSLMQFNPFIPLAFLDLLTNCMNLRALMNSFCFSLYIFL